jgi:hypothetical protein
VRLHHSCASILCGLHDRPSDSVRRESSPPVATISTSVTCEHRSPRRRPRRYARRPDVSAVVALRPSCDGTLQVTPHSSPSISAAPTSKFPTPPPHHPPLAPLRLPNLASPSKPTTRAVPRTLPNESVRFPAAGFASGAQEQGRGEGSDRQPQVHCAMAAVLI